MKYTIHKILLSVYFWWGSEIQGSKIIRGYRRFQKSRGGNLEGEMKNSSKGGDTMGRYGIIIFKNLETFIF